MKSKLSILKQSYQIILFLFILNIVMGCSGKTSSSSNRYEMPERIAPEFTVLKNTLVNLADFSKDKDGFINLIDGTSLKGWRGYGKEYLPERWVIDEEGCLTFNSSGNGDGGSIIFTSLFKNFELQLEWKIPKEGNSGIFYLVREVIGKDIEGKSRLEPIYISAPEYQILDNENYPDGRLGKNGNRKSGSLYDIIPANPQNANPFGEWNQAKIRIKDGHVIHEQNGEKVVEYHLWTPEWKEKLQDSKFSETRWPLAFELLNNCGGPEREGYIGLQDHGYDVWFRNIRIKILD